MNRMVSAFVAAWLAASSGSADVRAEALTPDEQRIVEAAAADAPGALALLARVVDINSGTMNFAGVRRVGEVFQGELRALGFETEWVDGAPFARAGHLVARRRGPGRRLLLVGHLDTVFEADSPFQRFERLSEAEARGPGIIDMKGGDVIIVSALKALTVAGVMEGDITVVMTGDEEDMGEPQALARQHLREAARAADVVLAFENGAGDPRQAVVARRGHTEWTLTVTARPAHSSQVFGPAVGAGAIFEAARVLSGFYERLSAETPLTLSPGLMLGGTAVTFDRPHSRGTAFGKTNVVPEHALVSGDLRAASPAQLAAAKATMLAIAGEGLPHATATLGFDDGYPPMGPTPGNDRLLAMYDQTSRDLGTGPVTATDPRDAGAADVAFTAGLVDMALDGIGLMGRDSHTVGETADLRTLVTQTQRAAVLMHRLLREKR
jgi:glutamate carboxypeptidase